MIQTKIPSHGLILACEDVVRLLILFPKLTAPSGGPLQA